MGRFERYLSVWVGLAIVTGVGLGRLFPTLFTAVAALEVAHINLVIAPLIWAMIYPMMLKVDPARLRPRVLRSHSRGLALTLVVNWLIKPFTMALLGMLFFTHLFADLVPAADAQAYIAGMVLLGVAPCTAMVFVWSDLTRGDAAFTLLQVSINDLIMVVAFAPLAALLLGVAEVTVPWSTLSLSVLLFVIVPLAAGLLTQRALRDAPPRLDALSSRLKPVGMVSLLATVALLFGLQADALLAQPGRVGLIAVPLALQSYGIFAVGYLGAKLLRLPFAQAAPAALIGTSNFFELAVAVAVSLFGLSSGAALATVVGVLIEVPVMLSLVAFANRTSHWFAAARPSA